jgi:hypothetical protein
VLIADVNGRRQLATKFLHRSVVARCPGCKQPVIAYCGDLKINHWGHARQTDCDWERGETDWHRWWKSLMEEDEVEVVRPDWPDNRADISIERRNHLVVVELQNSPITREMIQMREEAYPFLVWIVNVARYSFSAADGRYMWPRANPGWVVAKNVIFDSGTETFGRLRFWKASAHPSWDGEVYATVIENTLLATQGRYVVLPRPSDRASVLEMLDLYARALAKERSEYVRDQEDLPRRRQANQAAQRAPDLVLRQGPSALQIEFAQLDAEVRKADSFKERFRKKYGRRPSDTELGEARARGWKLI